MKLNTDTRLLGDVGATNARFSLLQGDAITHYRAFRCDAFPTLAEAIGAYLAGLPRSTSPPTQAALAVAAPVVRDLVQLTNTHWRFSIDALRRQFEWTRLKVLNDFEANALAVPNLSPDDIVPIGSGTAIENAAIGVVGPGTGLGVSGLIPSADGWTPLASEGGHVTLAPADTRESAVLEVLRGRFGHVSAERVLSGPGIVTLYGALCELAGQPVLPLAASQITGRCQDGNGLAREAVNMFSAFLGTLVGNVALTLGARGGIYIMGGIVPNILAVFRTSQFRERFEAKGRYRSYLAAIPTFVVIRPVPAFLGLMNALAKNR